MLREVMQFIWEHSKNKLGSGSMSEHGALCQAPSGACGGAAEIDPYAMMIRPEVEQPSGKFAAIINEDTIGLATASNEPIAYLNNVLGAHPLAHFDRERFAAEDIDDRQRANAPSIDELIRNEVHTPRLVHSARHETLAARHYHLASPR